MSATEGKDSCDTRSASGYIPLHSAREFTPLPDSGNVRCFYFSTGLARSIAGVQRMSTSEFLVCDD